MSRRRPHDLARHIMSASMNDATKAVWAACAEIAGIEGATLDPNASFFDLGLDSLGLAELVVQLEELYGDGVITIDDVLANPVVSEVAAKLTGGPANGALKEAPDKPTSSPAVSKATTKAAANAPTPKTSAMPALAKPSPDYVAPAVSKATTKAAASAPTPKTSAMPALAKPSPDYVATTPKTSEVMCPAAQIVERLEKLESGSRELREMVLRLSSGTPITLEPPGDDAPTPEPVVAEPVAPEPVVAEEGTAPEQGTAMSPGPESDWIRTTHVGSLPRDTGGETELCASALIARQRASP